MNKPLVFNYRKYEELLTKYTDLLYKYAKLKADNTNLQIRCRILQADLEEARNGNNPKNNQPPL